MQQELSIGAFGDRSMKERRLLVGNNGLFGSMILVGSGGYIGGILLVDIIWWLAVCNSNEIKDDVRIIALRDTSGLSRIHRR